MAKKITTSLENKEHWKSYFDHEYIGGHNLGKDVEAVVMIHDALEEVVVNHKTNEKKTKLILHFDEKGDKKMILNVTNSKMIERLYGTPNPKEWIGKKIQLCTTRITAFGTEHDALRVRDVVPDDVTVDVKDALKALKKCKSELDLRKVFTGLPIDQKSDSRVIELKDELKLSLA